MPTNHPNHKPPFEFLASRQFCSWLTEQQISLAFTTYQTGKLFLIGTREGDELSIFERTFPRCMGLYADNDTLYLSSLYQLWRFENALSAGQCTAKGYDRLYVPQMAYTTGDLDVHDIVVDRQQRIVFANTLFGCLATVSERYSFEPLWRPPFLSRLAAEDRCHLNGLALREGLPRYVTTVGQGDVHESWRDHRRDGGAVIDVENNEILATGLSMPHSPRWYRDRLWVLDSGSGHLGLVDMMTGGFEPVTFCPGYLRGLAFHGDFAILGLSKARNHTFSGLPLEQQLQKKGVKDRCGIEVIDLRSGDVVHSLHINGVVEELYDVVVLPGVRRPMAVGLKTDEIRRTITTPPRSLSENQ